MHIDITIYQSCISAFMSHIIFGTCNLDFVRYKVFFSDLNAVR